MPRWRPSYGWVVVGVSTAVNTLAWGVRGTFALFYVAMLAEFGWGRGAAAFGYSLSWLCFALFAPVAGRLFDRLGARLIVCISGVMLGVALALTSGVTSLAQYYVCFGVLGAAGLAGVIIPSTTIVTRWFTRSRGTAMGVLSAGTSGGAIVFYPINAWLIATLGWRSALVVFGGILAVATVSLALFYRDPSTDIATTPVQSARVTDDAWTLGRALRSLRLWGTHGCILPMIVVPPCTFIPFVTVTFTFAGNTRSVRELNFIRPMRSPRASWSFLCFQQTMRRARMPAICLQTTVTRSPSIVNAFCSFTRLALSLVAIRNLPFI